MKWGRPSSGSAGSGTSTGSRPGSGSVQTSDERGRPAPPPIRPAAAINGSGGDADEEALSEVLRVQVRLLKDQNAQLEKKLAEANEQVDKWKREAFLGLSKRMEVGEEDVRKSSLYLGAITQLTQARTEAEELRQRREEETRELVLLRQQAEQSRRLVEQARHADEAERALLAAEERLRHVQAAADKERDEAKVVRYKLEEQCSAMRETLEAQVRELEALRLDAHAAKQQEMGAASSTAVTKEMAGRWKVPPTERVMDYRYCSRSGVPGYLYVLTSHLVFESTVLGSVPVVISLHRLLSVDKIKSFSWLPGKGSAIELQYLGDADEELVLSLGSFFHRKEAVRAIIAQAERLRVPVRLLRGGQVDSNA